MNVYQKVRDQASRRLLLLVIGAGAVGGILGGLAAAALALAAVLAAPMVISVVAAFWTIAAEWSKLGVAELYGAAAQAKMQSAAEEDLRASLDAIGQEAFDELQRSIARRDESAA